MFSLSSAFFVSLILVLKLLPNLLILLVFSVLSFWLGRYSITWDANNGLHLISTNSSFKGRIYEISYPWNWTFDGPSEGPITGFPEFSKLISPSGDTQIIIGLRGDNRFEYVYDDIVQETKPAELMIGNKIYKGEEQFLDISEDPEFNIVLLEVEIDDKKIIGFSNGNNEAFLPMKIQILHRFSVESIPFEEKLKIYESEKAEAQQILQTLKFTSL